MRVLAGPGSAIHFTHLSRASRASLAFEANDDLADAKAHTAGILEWMAGQGFSLGQICLLDPKADKALSPEDGDGRFSAFLYGVSTQIV